MPCACLTACRTPRRGEAAPRAMSMCDVAVCGGSRRASVLRVSSWDGHGVTRIEGGAEGACEPADAETDRAAESGVYTVYSGTACIIKSIRMWSKKA